MQWRVTKNRVLVGLVSAVGLAVVTFGLLTMAASDSMAKPRINTLGLRGVAIKGYDAVAYFTRRKPTRGSKQHALRHGGVEWRFASAENKAAFAANPAKYKPAFGGYCAYGVSQGYLVKIEPHAWAIRGGRLYLNYNRSVQRTWNRRPGSYIATANKKWPRLIAK